MKIYGIGTDIVNISRIKKSIKNKKFIERVFNKLEIKGCNNKIAKENHYAKRFAAKEAFAKALGTGISKKINFKEIVIYNEKSGLPKIKLTGETKLIINKIIRFRKIKIFLSLSDDKPFALATVVITI